MLKNYLQHSLKLSGWKTFSETFEGGFKLIIFSGHYPTPFTKVAHLGESMPLDEEGFPPSSAVPGALRKKSERDSKGGEAILSLCFSLRNNGPCCFMKVECLQTSIEAKYLVNFYITLVNKII